MINFKKDLLIIILFFALIPIVFAYNAQIQINSNVADFHTDIYKCTNSGCANINYYSSSNTGTTQNSYTLSGSGDNYYMEYDYKSCYKPHIYRMHVWGDLTGVYPYSIDFTQKSDCIGAINNLEVSADNISIGKTITITATIHTVFEYPSGIPTTMAIPLNIQDEYSSKTKVTFYANNDQIYQTEEEILLASDKNFTFNWTPTSPGIYTIKAVSEVTDCACSSQNNQTDHVVVKVACIDADGDGYSTTGGSCGSVDCNDDDSSIYPGANEICDGKDNDCDGNVDEGGYLLCDDGKWCNGAETCGGIDGCQSGNPPDCDDGNGCTFDICNEDIDQCENFGLAAGTLCGQVRDCPDNQCNAFFAEFYPLDGHDTCDGNGNCIEYSCVMEDSYCTDNDLDDGVNGLECGAECDQDEDCGTTECDYLDRCVGKDYHDYNDVNNGCVGCVCENNQCGSPNIYYNDPRCTDCQTDDDCNYLNNDYCDGDIIKHKEGRCVNYECETETEEVEDCSQRGGIMNDCGLMEWGCIEKIDEVICVVKDVDPMDDFCSDFCNGDIKNEGSCNPITYNCDYTAEDCNSFNNDYCDGDLIKRDYYTCAIITNNSGWVPPPPAEVDCVIDETEVIEDCDDGSYCNGQETCDNAQCTAGMPIDSDDLEACCLESFFTWTNNGGNLNCCGDDSLEDSPYEATELTCDDGSDNDCDGLIDIYDSDCFIPCTDSDGDGYEDEACGGSDCNDGDNTIYPGANEVKCDGIDQDCDGADDSGTDLDGDGYKTDGGLCGDVDCDDNNANINPGADEVCDNLIDDDCDGLIDIDDSDCIQCTDDDGDTHYAISPNCPTGDDCDDNDDTIYPGASELCDGKDNNCDGVLGIGEVDDDGDGYMVCGGDCDDNDGSIHPGAKELSDGKDNNCNGLIDEGIIRRIIELPREKFFISKIRTNQLVYDTIKAGDQLFVDLIFENIGRRDTKYATIRVTVPELGISRKLGPFTGPEVDEVMSRGLYLDVPEDAKPGVYTVRISLSDISGIRRTRHRDFRIVE